TIDLTVTGLSYKLEGLEVDDGGITRKARNVPISKARNVSKLKSTREEEGEDDPITLTLTGIGTLTTLTNLAVPDELHGIPVTAIANSAFINNTTLTSVTMGKNIKTIGREAFRVNSSGGGNITTVHLNEGLETAHSYIFLHHKIVSLEVPSTMQIIIGGSFESAGTETLTSIKLKEGIKSIQGFSLANMTRLESITIPSTVDTIGDRAFTNAPALKDVYIDSQIIANVEDNISSLFTAAQTVYVKSGITPSNTSYIMLNFNKGTSSAGYTEYKKK
ncbi:MAG: leucine-rich repeat domain-containing protein, partial [Treponemataceae bacterium]